MVERVRTGSVNLELFHLKASDDDSTGRSFRISVPNDRWRDPVLRAFLADARAQKPTKVYVKGRIFVFDMPTNATTLTGLAMELESSRDIALGIPPD